MLFDKVHQEFDGGKRDDKRGNASYRQHTPFGRRHAHPVSDQLDHLEQT